MRNIFGSYTYNDVSPYWFAKYELERRKPESARTASAALDVGPQDDKATLVLKLLDYGFRAASRKYHPDRGGDTSVMQRLNEARDWIRVRLKQ